MQRSSRRLTVLIIVLLLTLTACSSVFSPGPTPTPLGAYQLSSLFRNLYEQLGGEPILGKAISRTFNHAASICQYTENVLFCYNKSVDTEANRVSLVPIGTLLVTTGTGKQYRVYEGFQAMYGRLFDERYVGKPLSDVLYNKEKRRIEQRFENMGFYQLVDDPRAVVHLLAYGIYACNGFCTYPPNSNDVDSSFLPVKILNLALFYRLGGFTVFGQPLSDIYTAADGSQEQLFENALLYVPKDDLNTLSLRPLAKMLGTRLEAPIPQGSRQTPGTVFYQVGDHVGYEVPVQFDEFIAAHGSKEISGEPTSSAFRVNENGVVMAGQCFTNFCLVYNPQAAAASKVSLMSLGREYLKQINPDVQAFEFSPQTTRLILSEKEPQVTANEEQTILVKVVQAKDLKPISEVSSILVVGLPDGSKPSFSLPPTDLKGNSSYTLPPVKNAGNGTLIPYVVCLNVPSTSIICQAQTYLIWNIK